MKRILTALVLGISLLVASGGFVYAQDLGKGLEIGDFATVLRKWNALAEQGDVSAQYNLGMMYYNGDGVLQDDVYAHMWWNIAASNGIANAVELEELVANSYANMAIVMRDLTAKTMTTEQLAEAQKLARECVRKKYKGC